MVSLENTRNAKGGFSFDTHTPIQTPINQDCIETITSTHTNDQVPLTVETEPRFKQIPTTFAIVLQIFTLGAFEGSLFLIPYFCGNQNENCKEFADFDIITFIHALLWILMFIFHRYYHYRHMQSRRNGYLDFYRNTRLRRSLPLYLISAGNMVLIILIKMVIKYCPVKCTSIDLKPIHFLQIFVSFENILILSILINYLVITVKFNTSKKMPDISTEIDRPAYLENQLKDVGYKDSTYLSNILENNADMIRYLQERNLKLTQKLYNKSDIANIN